MNCVIIGGGGFIGSHLAEALLAGGHDVTVFDRPGAPYLELLAQQGARLALGDFLQPADLESALAGAQVVFHLVSTTVPQTSNDDPVRDVQTNLEGTLHLLNAARTAGVGKIVFASSGGTVYGIPKEIPIKESHPTDPITSYGITKLGIEKYLRLYHYLHGLDYCVLRIANAYGERQPAAGSQGVIAAFLKKAIAGERIEVWGDGSQIRDYVYVKDIVAAMVKAAAYHGELKVFNIGTGQGHSLTDILHTLEDILQRPLGIEYLPGRKFDVPVNVLDISLARKCLGWEPAVNLRNGILHTYQKMTQETGGYAPR